MIMKNFADWKTKIVDLKKFVTTTDAQGRVIQSEESIATGIKINYWITRAVVTNENDKFVGQTLGKAIFPFSYDVKAKMFFKVDNQVHYITGVDNVAGLGEVLEVSWRREND